MLMNQLHVNCYQSVALFLSLVASVETFRCRNDGNQIPVDSLLILLIIWADATKKSGGLIQRMEHGLKIPM